MENFEVVQVCGDLFLVVKNRVVNVIIMEVDRILRIWIDNLV